MPPRWSRLLTGGDRAERGIAVVNRGATRADGQCLRRAAIIREGAEQGIMADLIEEVRILNEAPADRGFDRRR